MVNRVNPVRFTCRVLPATASKSTSEQVDALYDTFTRSGTGTRKLNLTRHTDYEKFVSRDVVDSRQLEQFLEPGERIVDVGTGGGVPGVVLSILPRSGSYLDRIDG